MNNIEGNYVGTEESFNTRFGYDNPDVHRIGRAYYYKGKILLVTTPEWIRFIQDKTDRIPDVDTIK